MTGTLDLVRTGSTRGSRRSRPSAWPRCARRSRPGVADRRLRLGDEPASPRRRGHVATPAGEAGPAVSQSADIGFMHAPSLTQAATVAVLRSGHLTHAGSRCAAICSRSTCRRERVRLAMAARRRAPGTAARRAARLSLRAPAARSPLGAVHRRVPRSSRRSSRASSSSDTAPKPVEVHRRQQRRRRPGAAAALAERQRTTPAPVARQHDSLWPAVGSSRSGCRRRAERSRTSKAFWTRARSAGGRRGRRQRRADSPKPCTRSCAETRCARPAPWNRIAGGETPPPELEVVRTPRTGIALTHRLVTLFSGRAALPRNGRRPRTRIAPPPSRT